MKATQWCLVAMAGLLGSGCVDTISPAQPSDDAPLLGEDAIGTSDAQFAATVEPLAPVGPAGSSSWLCYVDKDCQSLGNACNLAYCAQGLCKVKPLAVSAPCDDGDPCTVNTVCRMGACLGTNICATEVRFLPFYWRPPSPYAVQ